ncbi:MAG: helix-turn-helix domain-containing protein [Rhodocyclaceae bacterium]
MNAVLPRENLLLSELMALTQSDVPRECLSIRSVHSHQIKAFNVDAPMLALPLQGYKRVCDKGEWLHVAPGELFVVPGPRTLDIENYPAADGGDYMAVAIPLYPNALQAARLLLQCAAPQAVEAGRVATVPLSAIAEPLARWIEALRSGEPFTTCHAVVGILLRLHALGHRSLLNEPVLTLAMQIRAMVAAEPARDWASSDIEDALGMSGATLRRRLAAEGLQLRAILAEARLSLGLNLLLSTRLPVKSVAARVGYASVSSFVKRFSERYGVEPSRVGGN